MSDAVWEGASNVRAAIAYSGRSIVRPRYHANDQSRDVLEIVAVPMDIEDARGCGMTLDEAGFTLVGHRSAVADFADSAAVNGVHRQEVIDLVKELSGADAVLVNSPGILRFSEKSPRSGALDNSRPARFVHFNVWRAISAPPQDVPLAVCHAGSIKPADLIKADAVFDAPGRAEWSFEGIVVAHNPAHRWHWFPDMGRDEALVFKTHDSDAQRAHCVPHVAFDDPSCDPRTPPRASIEMRALALWLE